MKKAGVICAQVLPSTVISVTFTLQLVFVMQLWGHVRVSVHVSLSKLVCRCLSMSCFFVLFFPSIPFRLKAVQTADMNWLKITIFDLCKQQRMCNRSTRLWTLKKELDIKNKYMHNSNEAAILRSTSFIQSARSLNWPELWNEVKYHLQDRDLQVTIMC